MKKLVSLIIVIICLFTSISYAGDSTSDISVVDRIEVNGEFTYRHCLNECGIEYDHYIDVARVTIVNDCIQDYGCANCMDRCAEELRHNNPEVYNSIMDHTYRNEY